MPKTVKPLNDTQIKNAKAKAKDYKLSDGYGLILLVKTSGAKYWRFNYIFANKQKTISVGVYPQTSLKEARQTRDEYKEYLKNKLDPQYARVSQSNTIESIAQEWRELNRDRFADSYQKSINIFINKRIIPKLGHYGIQDLTVQDIIRFGKNIEAEGHIETLDKTLNTLSQIFTYAVSMGYTKHNIVKDIDKKSVFKRIPQKNYPVITDSKELRKLLLSIDEYHGNIVTRYALKLAPHVFLRPANIRFAEWSEINFEKKIYRIPPEKMKMKDPHIVPLSNQVIKILQELKEITGRGKYLFPSPVTTTKPISDGTLVKALRRLDYTRDEIVAHSFRGIASTILHENISVHGIHSDAIERQLAHLERNKVKAAYNHAEYLTERTKLMQWWSDYLESIKKG
ncbi:MAG: tyrosine-type recombinase/integrase [Campylobacteraceae bacterium]|nr:tyrosine-type recombinase/integrase [Campylobacteraceae bacterium]